MRFWFEWVKALYFLEFGAPSMPAPAAPPPDPATDPAAIAARQSAERDAEISASHGATANMVAGEAMAEEAQQKRGAARSKLGYGS